MTRDTLEHLCHLCFKVPSDETIVVMHGEKEENRMMENGENRGARIGYEQ
jgi:hypothetical protein